MNATQRLSDSGPLERYGTGLIHFAGNDSGLYERHLLFDNVVAAECTSTRDRFEAFARSGRDVLSQRWTLAEDTYTRKDAKRIYYLSMEFLIGRSLANNVSNLLLGPVVQKAVRKENLNWIELLEQEPDVALGNGGLGRLAACFLESMATLQLPAMRYGLRYEYGIFKQTIEDGWQRERPDNWLRRQDPWEVARPHESVEVRLNCSFEVRGGTLRAVPGRPSSLIGMPFDRPVVGYGGGNINTLRLWAAGAPDYFDFQAFSHGDFVKAVAETLEAESITRVLYPDDSTSNGQALRFFQEYFLVACSLADLVRRFRRTGTAWEAFPDKVSIQLNDTHPALAIPELMPILLDDEHLGWDQAWEITRKTFGYTNHTLLPEALEKWPLAWFEEVRPRHLEIVFEINLRLLEMVRSRSGGDQGLVRVSLIDEDGGRKVRMANLAIVGSHSTNGVAAIHSQLLRTTTVKDLAGLFPDRFNNKTNGVTPRRWLLLSNPALAEIITSTIGAGWITDLSQLKKLKPLAESSDFRLGFRKAKYEAKVHFADWLKRSFGVFVDPETIFDSQIKRIHEYKRQLLNALRIVGLYNRLRENPRLEMTPRTFLFAGKAAPAYQLARLIIKFINNIARTVDADPAWRGRLNVVFLPEYSVSLAERALPSVSPLAGKPAPKAMLIDPARIERDYYDRRPDINDPSQKVSFGTSGHRGSPLDGTFTEAHILAITQAICDYRRANATDGPVYLGKDTHAVSGPAQRTALEVLAANGVDVMIQRDNGVTPTPAVSRAILAYNRGRKAHFADGIVITPSHNPPKDGGFKYNPPNGGPADTDVTQWVENRANEMLRGRNAQVKRIPFASAVNAPTTHQDDFMLRYVRDLKNVIDMDAIRAAGLKLAVDPLGGAAGPYWGPINEEYQLDVAVVNDRIDPAFSFMTVDHDGVIRMDCSSLYAMVRLVGLKGKYRLAFGNDPDADRHGIVTPAAGLMNPNHYLAVAIRYLLTHRAQWPVSATVGKTLVSSGMIDKVVQSLGRRLYEVPVGFKWFVSDLVDGSCCFGSEESAGASFLRHDGAVWTTDKDGLIMVPLAAEITARTGKDPGEHYAELTAQFGAPLYTRVDAPATPEQKARLRALTPEAVTASSLAGEPIVAKLTCAPGDNAPIGGLKVVTSSGWFAARPSGTENIYKIYAESFTGQSHLDAILAEAEGIVSSALNSKGRV